MATTRSEAKWDTLEKMVINSQDSVTKMQEEMNHVRSNLLTINKSLSDLGELKTLVEKLVRNRAGEPPDREDHYSPADLEETIGEFHRIPRGEEFEDLRLAMKRFEIPAFNGVDPVGWLSKAEQYFEIHGTPLYHRLKIAHICMEGTAVHWFQWARSRNKNWSWERFAEELVNRYSGRKATNPFELLASLKQEGRSVDEYIEEFEVLIAQVGDLPELQCMGYFLSGLREELRLRLRTHGPRTITRAMDLARSVEEELTWLTGRSVSREGNVIQRREGRQRWTDNLLGRAYTVERPKMGRAQWTERPVDRNEDSSNTNSKTIQSTFRQINTNSTPTVGRGNNGRFREGRILSHQEYLNRREKGLCYRCGELYNPLHKCANKSLKVAVLIEDEDEEEATEEMENEVGDNSGNHTPASRECNTLELPLFSIGGINQPQTMKLRGRLRGKDIVVMMDSGASHNFVSRKLVEKLELEVDETVKFGVFLGDGARVTCQGICRQLIVDLSQCEIQIDSYVFELGGVDLILGIDWLRTLGEVVVNWEDMRMSFDLGNGPVTLTGDPGLNRSMISKRSLLKLAGVEYSGLLWSTILEGSKEGVENQSQELERLLREYEKLFEEPRGLPPNRSREHAIILKEGSEPVQVRPYRYAHQQKDEIEKLVAEMLQSGIIQPSCSPFSSPVILVKKKDGSWRFCVDYRALNDITIADKFPLPVIDELLDELHGAQWFSKLDMKSGYHQIRVKTEDVHKTAFRTHEGHYEFLVMPFGLKNAPATFQATMNEVLRPFLRKFVLVFLDDILIFSRGWEEHLVHLQQVLEVLLKHQLLLNRKKCDLGLQQVEYLGHIITAEGVAVDPRKVAAVKDWPKPATLKGLRGFLGLTGYYRKFVKDYGKIARPLTDLLKKDSFGWNAEAETAFDKLKDALSSTPVLRMPDFKQGFTIDCDASGRGVGAVLSQAGRPIAFFSKALAPRTLSKSTYEKELMALVLAIQHWRPYLLGRKFVVWTDHRSLTSLLRQRVTTPDQQHWLRKLLGYEFEVKYKAGTQNGAADALSRRQEEMMELKSISVPVWVEHDAIKEAVQKDSKLKDIIQSLEKGDREEGPYTMLNGVLLHRGRVVVPRESLWPTKLIREAHMTPIGGHAGALKTLKRIASSFFWAGMQGDVAKFIAGCDVCQRQKYAATKPAGLLQPLAIPTAIWEDITMDFIVGLPKSRGFDVIMVVVDRLSKYAHFILLKHPISARGVAEVFNKEIMRLHGTPQSIISDRDPIFMSQFWKEYFRLQGTQLRMSSAYHPETDGQTEVVNRCLETYLRCFSSEQPRTWAQWIPWAEFWYNTSYHTATGMTPFEIVYGKKAPKIIQFWPQETSVAAVAQELSDRDELLRQVKFNLHRAQQRMIKQADAKRREVKFEVGDRVYLKLRPHRQQSVCRRIYQKLAPRYYGPFQILQKVGEVAYKLNLPPSSKIHPVFHVSCLKKAVGQPGNAQPLPKGLESDLNMEFEPEYVVAERYKQVGGEQVQQVLIRWKGRTDEEDTWEEVAALQNQFPDFSLEDKAISKEAGIVRNEMRTENTMGQGTNGPVDQEQRNRPAIKLMYSRRRKGAGREEGKHI
ncbi:hypothetical protein F511_08762 [Dorcoceras hygrometricum]|uniref:Peroxidase 64 n=1 Tax=Dorcoceras hygrometricum TaxID=472368 RepID=A0A2Z7AJS3_9LAMI|nr:hypothetical protein F511_08762 [Dorcoceras hygrometricum]